MANTFNTQSIASALSQIEQDMSKFVNTWNGAKQFSEMGTSFLSKLVELDFKFVVPKECYKTRMLDQFTRDTFDAHYDKLMSTVQLNNMKQYETLFRYLFYSRSFRDTGKGSRLGFYYMFQKLYNDFPGLAKLMLDLIPEYGSFADLDNLVEVMGKEIIPHIVDVYVKHMNSDSMILFGKEVAKVTTEDLEEFKKKDMTEFMKGKHLSLAFKWLKSNDKHNSTHRLDILAKLYYPNGGLKEYLASKDHNLIEHGMRRLRWCDMMLRKMKSCVGMALDVVEQKMCSNRFSEINMESVPAGAMSKYTKAFSNELLKEDVPKSMEETGNRYPDNMDRVTARKNLLKSIEDTGLKGLMTDIRKMSDAIFKDVYMQGTCKASKMKRLTVAAQFKDLVSRLKEKVDAVVIQQKADNANFIDPRDVLGMVDVSGSMVSANVLSIAIMLGVIGAHLSDTFRGMVMTFTDNPSIIRLDMENGDIYDHFMKVLTSPVGYSTNLQACFDLLLDVTKKSGVKATSMGIVMYTDCMINTLVKFGPNDSQNKEMYNFNEMFNKTIVGYVGSKYKAAGYDQPRLIFWNLNGGTPGFPAQGGSTGIQMVSGFSQTLMNQVFTGDYVYEVTEDGSQKVTVTPEETLMKALYSTYYDKVGDMLSKSV